MVTFLTSDISWKISDLGRDGTGYFFYDKRSSALHFAGNQYQVFPQRGT